MRRIWILLAGLSVLGCEGPSGFRQPGDGGLDGDLGLDSDAGPPDGGDAETGDRAVRGDGAGPLTRIEGAVWPLVAGARVQVEDLSEGVLAESVTDADGRFAIDAPAAGVWVVVQGGPSARIVGHSGDTLDWPAPAELRAALTDTGPLVVSPLTDLAAALAASVEGPPRVAEITAALADHFGLSPEHLAARPGEAGTLSAADFDPLTFAAACLARQAEEVGGEQPLALVDLYRRDAADGVIDGRAEGAWLHTGSLRLPADPLRADLARGCARWLDEGEGPLSRADVATHLQLISMNDDPLLFGDVEASPLDTAGPRVELTLVARSRDAWGAGPLAEGGRARSVAGVFEVVVRAHDPSGIAALDLAIEPARSGLSGPFERRALDPATVEARWLLALVDGEPGALDLVARASDVHSPGHVTVARWRLLYDDAPPQIHALRGPGAADADGRWHTNAPLGGSTRLVFRVEDVSPVLRYEVEISGAALEPDLVAQGQAGAGQQVDVDLPLADLSEGEWQVEVVVRDALGHQSSAVAVLVVDRTPPTIALLPGGYFDERTAAIERVAERLRFIPQRGPWVEWGEGAEAIEIYKTIATLEGAFAVSLAWSVRDEMSAEVTLSWGEQALERAGEAFVLPIDEALLGPFEAIAPGTVVEASLTATDLAGNVATTPSPRLHLFLFPPPVFAEWVAPADALHVADLSWGALSEPWDALSYGALRIHNPWPVPLEVTVSGPASVEITGEAVVAAVQMARVGEGLRGAPLPDERLVLAEPPACLLAEGAPDPALEVLVNPVSNRDERGPLTELRPRPPCARFAPPPFVDRLRLPLQINGGLGQRVLPAGESFDFEVRSPPFEPDPVDPEIADSLASLWRSGERDFAQRVGLSARAQGEQRVLFWAPALMACPDGVDLPACRGAWAIAHRVRRLRALAVPAVEVRTQTRTWCADAACPALPMVETVSQRPGRSLAR